MRALILRSLPLYAVFFLWGLGTGAQQLARPLFAASFGVPIFFVSLIQAANSLAWLVSAPTTGWLTDKFGRKPLTIAGNLLRGLTMLLQFFATNYLQFALLEFVGGIGVATWVTGSSVIMTDITQRENRGRAMAIRSLSMKLGLIAGLFLGGLLARAFQLRAIFLFGFVTKIPIHLLLALLVRETRPQGGDQSSAQRAVPEEKLGVATFVNRPVLVLAFAIFTLSTATAPQGVFGSLFPLYAKDAIGLSTDLIGQLLGLAGIAGVLVSFPNGMLSDRYGRKKSLVPGLLLLSLSVYTLAQMGGYGGLLLVTLIYGLGEGMSMSTSEVSAMDLAPEKGRGTFLGIWSVSRNVGGLLAPVLVGLLAQGFGMPASFMAIGGLLVVGALLLTLFGLETRAGRVESPAPMPG